MTDTAVDVAIVPVRRCGNITEQYAVAIICVADTDHYGDHHARDRRFAWPDPPPTVIGRCGRCAMRRRTLTRERTTHPYSGGAAWLWVYRCPRGHYRRWYGR